jgi:O-antigen ligase
MQKILSNKIYLTMFLVTLWQLVSIGLVAAGGWPAEVLWLNFALVAILILIFPPVAAVGIMLLSLPFLVVLPEHTLPNLPMWRPLVGWLFLVVSIKYLWQLRVGQSNLLSYVRHVASDFYNNKLNAWDKWIAALVLLALLSLAVADFPEHGLKQIVFVLNTYLLYLASVLAISNTEDWTKLLKYLKFSLLVTVALGFVQYFATFFSDPYYFWQYWATFISGVYYGQPLAEVLAYSNSWFSAEASGENSLRMFGILQDTHAFAVIVIFGMAIWWALAKLDVTTTRVRHLFQKQSYWYWIVLALLGFAIIASGTRGVWVAAAIPMAATLLLIYKFKARLLGALPLLSFTLIIILFLLSPWITMSFNFLRSVALEDNFLRRAASVYDLSEDSNMGRLEIWKDSLSYSLQNPLGTGYGNFITSIVDAPENSSFEEVSAEKNLRYNVPQKFITAHSLYLHILVELGLTGLILFLIFWLSVAKQTWRAVSEAQFAFSALNLFFVAIAIALLWLLAYGLFDVTILNERVLLYLMTLLALLNMALRHKPLTLF